LILNDRKTSIKRRDSNRRRVSNKRRGLEATLEYQPYTLDIVAYTPFIATENLELTQIIPCFLAKQVDVNAERVNLTMSSAGGVY